MSEDAGRRAGDARSKDAWVCELCGTTTTRLRRRGQGGEPRAGPQRLRVCPLRCTSEVPSTWTAQYQALRHAKAGAQNCCTAFGERITSCLSAAGVHCCNICYCHQRRSIVKAERARALAAGELCTPASSSPTKRCAQDDTGPLLVRRERASKHAAMERLHAALAGRSFSSGGGGEPERKEARELQVKTHARKDEVRRESEGDGGSSGSEMSTTTPPAASNSARSKVEHHVRTRAGCRALKHPRSHGRERLHRMRPQPCCLCRDEHAHLPPRSVERGAWHSRHARPLLRTAAAATRPRASASIQAHQQLCAGRRRSGQWRLRTSSCCGRGIALPRAASSRLALACELWTRCSF